MKKSIAIGMSLLLICMLLVVERQEVWANTKVDLSNTYIQVQMNEENGRYTIETIEGSPYRAKDNHKPLLYSHKDLDTSFVTVHVDGEAYIYGNDYPELNSYFSEAPHVVGNSILSTWVIDNMAITQRLDVEANEHSSSSGNVRIQYQIENQDDSPHLVGMRILLDTNLGEDDGAVILLPDKTYVDSERELLGGDIPDYYTLVESSDQRDIVAYNVLKGWENHKPDRLVFAHWNTLSRSKWDAQIDSSRVFAGNQNKYHTSDSACALYWNPDQVAAGETKTLETYYGLGDLASQQENLEFLANLQGPARLSMAEEGTTSGTFKVELDLDNTLTDSKRMYDVSATLILPTGLALAEGESAKQELGTLDAGAMTHNVWQVVATYGENISAYTYKVKVSTLEEEQETISKTIVVPGRKKEIPEVFYTDFYPKVFGQQDELKHMVISGKGFSLLQDKSLWDLYVVEEPSGEPLYIDTEDIRVIDDETIQVFLKEQIQTRFNWDTKYGIYINHKQKDDYDYHFNSSLLVSNDKSLMPRVYEQLVVREQIKGGRPTYHVEVAKQSTGGIPLDTQQGRKIITLSGRITSLMDGSSYSIESPDIVRIGEQVYYEGTPIMLSLDKSGSDGLYDQLSFVAEGSLYTRSKIAGRSIDLPLLEGRIVYDTEAHLLELDDSVPQELALSIIGSIPIKISHVKLFVGQGIQVGGEYYFISDKIARLMTTYVSTPIIAELDGVNITPQGISYQGRIPIPLPGLKIGSFWTKSGYPSYLIIDTVNGEYGFETTWENRSLRLDKIAGTLMFNSNFEPKSLKVKADFKPLLQIGSSGFGISSIDGGVYGLQHLWKGDMQDMRLVAGCQIEDIISGNFKIGGRSFFNGYLTGTLSHTGLGFTGDAYIYFLPIANVSGHIGLTGGYVNGNMNILDVMKGSAGVRIDNIGGSGRFYAGGDFNGALYLPGGYKIIGGKKVSGFKAGINRDAIYSSFTLLECDIGVEYSFKKHKVGFDIDFPDVPVIGGLFGQWNMTNMETIPSNMIAYDGNLQELLAYRDSKVVKHMTIEDIETALITISYTGTEKPYIEITNPNGDLYPLAWEGESSDPNALHQLIPADVSSSKKEERHIGITIPSPMNGSWTITSDRDILVEGYHIKDIPTFQSVDVTKESTHTVKVKWSVATEEDTYLSFYLVPEDDPSALRLIEEQVEASLHEIQLTLPEDTPTGYYRILAKSLRGTYGQDEMASMAFHIVDPKMPATPTGFLVESIGNGYFSGTWNTPAVKPTYYRLQPVNSLGAIDDIGEVMEIDGDATSIEFGGIYQDKEGHDYGWFTDRDYNLQLIAIYEEADKKRHLSLPAETTGYLRAPNPPSFHVNMFAMDEEVALDPPVDDIIYSDSHTLELELITDVSGTYTVTLNDQLKETNNIGNRPSPITLRDGENRLRITVVDDQGEMNRKDYLIICDTKAPYLAIQSPKSIDYMTGDTVLVDGVTEQDATVMVNGQEVTVGSDGHFVGYVKSKDIIDHQILIEAMDGAKNTTTYRATIYQKVSEMKEIAIEEPTTSIEVLVPFELRANAVSAQGAIGLLPREAVRWTLYGDSHGATLTDEGFITFTEDVEVLVKAAYYVTEDYAFEDIIALRPMVYTPPVTPPDEEEDSSRESDPNRLSRFLPGDKKTLVSFQEDLSLEVLEGSLSGYDFITVRRMTKEDYAHMDMEELISRSDLFILGLKNNDKLDKKGILTMAYDPDDNPDEKVGIYRYTASGWVLVGGMGSKDTGQIRVRIDEMGLYGVFYNPGLRMMKDAVDSWAIDSIHRLTLEQVIDGIPQEDGSYHFNPKGQVTRSAFMKMLVALRLGETQIPDTKATPIFADHEQIPIWALPYVTYAYKQGWLQGTKKDGSLYFMPEKPLTRAEAITLIGRLMEAGGDTNLSFQDSSEIPSWARDYVSGLVETGIITGYGDGTLRPLQRITREEAAVILDRYLRFMGN